MERTEIRPLYDRLMANMETVIKGKSEVIGKVILCLLCGGHILLEDLPGTGKTTLIKALSKSLDCRFTRVQFTPDLLPSDLTGAHVYSQKTGEVTFRPGPVFTNLLLADEINRATPRTQSSLLECMEEGQVSIDGETMKLSQPFFVAATQNPIEIQGTFPLPEAQLDRFFMRLSVGYPEEAQEKEMLRAFRESSPLEQIHGVVTADELLQARRCIREIPVSDAVLTYLQHLVAATRRDEAIRLGVSPRGSLALLRASQAHAAVSGRESVWPDDVKAVFGDVLAHRIQLRGHNLNQSPQAHHEALSQILALTPVPTEKG